MKANEIPVSGSQTAVARKKPNIEEEKKTELSAATPSETSEVPSNSGSSKSFLKRKSKN